MKTLGLKDLPITNRDDEALGIGDYADVLTEFIRNCDTPITIALQGDWGSGKTSLMNLIRNELITADSKQSPILTIWFNTWQYSQFDSAGTLPLVMMQKLTTELSKITNNSSDASRERIGKFGNMLKQIGKAVAVGGGSLIGQADTFKEMLGIIVEDTNKSESNLKDFDQANILSEVKQEIEEIIHEATNKENGPQKLVVFVDDLDRITPIRAVELLESMKIFLDIDKCVYVLACDYGVVKTGLKEKFNVDAEELKDRDFFDKIIQVPFKMPLKRYQPEHFLKELLDKNIDLQFFYSDDIPICSSLIENSIGFNPRSIKRLLNMLQLLVILEEKYKQKNEIKPVTDIRHSNRVMFGILCMIEAYEPIYDYIVKDVYSRMEQIQSGLVNIDSNSCSEIKEQLGDSKFNKAVEFCKVFVDCIQLDDDKGISRKEIEHLTDLFSHTSLVGHGANVVDFDVTTFSSKVKKLLNDKYKRFVTCKSPKYGQFRKSYNVVYLPLPRLQHTDLCLAGDKSTFQFGLRSIYSSSDIQKLGNAMLDKFQWEGKGRSQSSDDIRYFWFLEMQNDLNDTERVLERYLAEVYKRLDRMTKRNTSLYEVIKWFEVTTSS